MGQVTVTNTSALIFGTYADAIAYFNVAIRNEAWTAAPANNRQRALVSSTRWLAYLDLVDLQGTTLEPTILDTSIPEDIKFATYELAQALLSDSDLENKASKISNLRSVRAGSVEIIFTGPGQHTVILADKILNLPSQVLSLIVKYRRGDTEKSTGAFASGTSTQSAFVDSYIRSGGYT